MKSTRTANLFILHVIVLIWGFTGILGKEISLDAFRLVWWRVLIAVLAIAVFALFMRRELKVKSRDLIGFAGVGLLTGAHWICFFGSIKAANISVALVVISTTAFFVAIIAPLVRKERFRVYELFLGIVVVVGLTIIFRFEARYTKGIILSLCAALFAALFSTINSTFVARHSPTKIAFWEMLFAFLGVSAFLLIRDKPADTLIIPGARDLALLVFLGVVCTGVAFIVSIDVMKVLSPFTCALAINMEPVYTIVLAVAIYGRDEYMSPQFYAGALIIMATLFADAAVKYRVNRLKSKGAKP